MGGGWTHLVGVTELRRMVGNDPNLALSVLHGLGRWEAGRSGGGGGGMDPQRKGWVRVGEEGGVSSTSSNTSSGARTPPPKAAKPPLKAPKKPMKPCHFESSEGGGAPPAAPHPKPKAKAPPQTPARPIGE